jgi:branched-chain amino acid transport system ATP-binding protein
MPRPLRKVGEDVFALENITAGYGATTVLRNVTLHVPSGSVVALLGANGAGKTTLVRVASGLLRTTDGRLMMDGEDVTGETPHRLAERGVCHIPEGRGVFPPLTVRENLVLFSPPKHETSAIERAVEAFPALSARLDQIAGTMSGGQQQMLALARAYICGARLIFLDEVSMGLAPIIVDEIYEFLERLTNEGVALLLVEQYVDKALAIADYAYILRRGEVAFAGDASELVGEDMFRRYVGTDVAALSTAT